MVRIIKILPGIVAIIGLSHGIATAQMQGQGMQGRGVEMRVQFLQDRLGLSDDQADKVSVLLETEMGKSNCREESTFSKRRACREKKRSEMDEKLKTIFSSEQQTQFAELRTNRAFGRFEKNCGGRGQLRGANQ